MFKDFIQHITEGTTFIGLEINNSNNGNSYHFVELKIRAYNNQKLET